MSQERKRRLAIAAFIVGGLAGGLLGALLGALERPVSGSPIAGLLESPPALAGAVAVGVAASAITVRTFDAGASMALVGACTGGAVALGLAAILRER